jgi:hypothetical protein
MTWRKAVDAFGLQWGWAGQSSTHMPFDWTGPPFGSRGNL